MSQKRGPAVRESEFFIGEDRFYVTIYDSGAARWVVMVPPLFEELARTRKLCVNAARKIADAGVNVIRFDYYGTGLSQGRFEDFTLAQAERDLDAVLALCRERKAEHIALLGFRFGAYLAARRNNKAGVERVIVWEPVLDLGAYMAETLKSTAVDQIVTYGAVRFSQEQLMDKLGREGRILVNGYALGRTMIEEFRGARGLGRSDCEKLGVVIWRQSTLSKISFISELRPLMCAHVKVAWDHIKFLDHDAGELAGATLKLLATEG